MGLESPKLSPQEPEKPKDWVKEAGRKFVEKYGESEQTRPPENIMKKAFPEGLPDVLKEVVWNKEKEERELLDRVAPMGQLRNIYRLFRRRNWDPGGGPLGKKLGYDWSHVASPKILLQEELDTAYLRFALGDEAERVDMELLQEEIDRAKKLGRKYDLPIKFFDRPDWKEERVTGKKKAA